MDDSVEMPPYDERPKKGFNFTSMRLILTLVFPILTCFLLAFFIGIVVVLFGESSVSSSIFVPSQCKIVSNSKQIDI
ncbi:hypothetical protein CICLE_v10003484mg [Citrus x clementina]|uniref:Uncharacterized protein n=1 Tax=Citrus clementina TaxID=85681 RepID=V4T3V8_CITCL|nr:hypothetical protein CICLE_v10003484mg [Citrus x clementina]